MAVPLPRKVKGPYARRGGYSNLSDLGRGELPTLLPDSPVSSLTLQETPIDTPRPKRMRDRPRRIPGSTSTSTQSTELSSDTDV